MELKELIETGLKYIDFQETMVQIIGYSIEKIGTVFCLFVLK